MPKRKKHMKLPNGYGSIKYLGPKRRRPYAVHPPTKEFTDKGVPITPKALCYVDDWHKGFMVLTAYKAGTYYPGFENTISDEFDSSDSEIVNKILADYSLTKAAEERDKIYRPTFEDVYHMFWEWKFEKNKKVTCSKDTKSSYSSAFNNCAVLHHKIFSELCYDDLQDVIDDSPLGYSSKQNLVKLFHQMYKFAEIKDLCTKNHSAHVSINTPNDNKRGVPFTDSDLKILWGDKDNPVAELLLILCYSGFRIGELETLYIDFDEMYFQGGIKTDAGKNRIVPVHSSIQDIVTSRINRYGTLLNITPGNFRKMMYKYFKEIGIEKHTPHDCRHTFSMLCERYEVKENDRKRLLGHSFEDVTNAVYGHRSLEDLRNEIEKIKVCY